MLRLSAVPGSETYTCFLSSFAARLLHPCLCSLESSLCRQTSKINNALPPTPCWVTAKEHARGAHTACTRFRAAAVPTTHIHTLSDTFHKTASVRKHCQAPPSPSLFVSFCLSPSTSPSTFRFAPHFHPTLPTNLVYLSTPRLQVHVAGYPASSTCSLCLHVFLSSANRLTVDTDSQNLSHYAHLASQRFFIPQSAQSNRM